MKMVSLSYILIKFLHIKNKHQISFLGIPSYDNKGEKINKSTYKKLRKDWEKQKKLYESSLSK